VASGTIASPRACPRRGVRHAPRPPLGQMLMNFGTDSEVGGGPLLIYPILTDNSNRALGRGGMVALMNNEDQQSKTYVYGRGIAIAAISIGFLIVLYYISPEFLSDDVKWHLWSTSFPLIIPNIIIKASWWILFAMYMFGLIAAGLPKAVVKVGVKDIVVQNPLTRNFATITFDDALDFIVTDYYILLFDRNNRTASIAKLYLSRKDYKEITDLLSQRVRNALNPKI
jgi:hypothetical protein